MSEHITQLASGLTIATDRVPGAVGGDRRLGRRRVPRRAPELSGVSHFLEHLLFKGTPTRTATEISRAVDRVGGDINAFTSKEYTAYYCRMPAPRHRNRQLSRLPAAGHSGAATHGAERRTARGGARRRNAARGWPRNRAAGRVGHRAIRVRTAAISVVLMHPASSGRWPSACSTTDRDVSGGCASCR